MTVDEFIQQIETELNQVANSDGAASKEEMDLITLIMHEVRKYKTILDLALEDKKIDEKERIRLFQGKLDIIQKTVGKMKDDLIISKDEQAILRRLQELLPQISEYEDEFASKL